MQEITKQRAKYLTKYPEIAARIVELNAEGKTTYNLHKQINKEFKHNEGHIDLTSMTVRWVIHQKYPFNNAIIQGQVDPQHAAIVRAKFRKHGDKKVKKVKAKKSNVVEISSAKSKLLSAAQLQFAIHVAETRLAYEEALTAHNNALAEAVQAGMSEKNITALVDIIMQGDLLK